MTERSPKRAGNARNSSKAAKGVAPANRLLALLPPEDYALLRPHLDRRGLERRSCECYGISKREFDRLLDDRTKRAA